MTPNRPQQTVTTRGPGSPHQQQRCHPPRQHSRHPGDNHSRRRNRRTPQVRQHKPRPCAGSVSQPSYQPAQSTCTAPGQERDDCSVSLTDDRCHRSVNLPWHPANLSRPPGPALVSHWLPRQLQRPACGAEFTHSTVGDGIRRAVHQSSPGYQQGAHWAHPIHLQLVHWMPPTLHLLVRY